MKILFPTVDIYGLYYLGESLFNWWRIYCKNCWWCLRSLPSSFHCKSTSKAFKNSQRKLIWKWINYIIRFCWKLFFHSVVQDTVQGFHWENLQAKLHPCFDETVTLICYKRIQLELIVYLLRLYVFSLLPICSLHAREKNSAVAIRLIYSERNFSHF